LRVAKYIYILLVSAGLLLTLVGNAAEKKAKKIKKSPPPVASVDEVTAVTTRTWQEELEVAQNTLAYVQKMRKLPVEADALRRLELQLKQYPGDEPLLKQLKALRRKIIFSHPALQFDRLLVNQNAPTLYSHNCDQYLGRHTRPGRGILILEDWQSGNPRVSAPLEGKLPDGAFNKPKLHWDGKRIVFAFADHTESNKNHRRFFVYEAALDGSRVSQLTGTPSDPLERWGERYGSLIEDNDPCYLPDGNIAFVSTRCQGFGRCHNGRYTPSLLMYRCAADGSGIKMLSWGEANETDPMVMPDGRIVYTRWEYVNRNVTMFHMLWWMKPDGTQPSNFYGNDTRSPWMISEAVSIPNSHKVVALATGHHSFSTGTILTIDPAIGEDGPEPVRRVTPLIKYFEAEKDHTVRGCYSTPWPVTEDIFLAAYSPQPIPGQGRTPADDYAIYLVDTFGGRELIYRSADGSCFSPTPLIPREMPPVMTSSLAKNAPMTGILSIQNVYQNMNDPEGVIKPGEITALRVNEILNQPAVNKNNAQPSLVRHEVPKKVLGTVPVEKDGSAMFIAPAGKPIQLQALDVNGMAVMSMRTFITLQPGENRSCVGCHEQRGSTPAVTIKLAMGRPPSQIMPPAGQSYKDGFSFLKTVQPVFDRHCIKCHGLGSELKGKMDLTAVREKQAQIKGLMKSLTAEDLMIARSYNSLLRRPGLVALHYFKGESDHSLPKEKYAAASKLALMIKAGHGKVKLTQTEKQNIFDWLDLNAQCYGDYSWNRVEHRVADPVGERALRAYVKEIFGDTIANQPYETLVNVGLPDQSRVLKAPLSQKAGGWEQISPSWSSMDDAGYRKMAQLVEASIKPLQYHDVDGTCGRAVQGGKCVCGSCWVRDAEEKFAVQIKGE